MLISDTDSVGRVYSFKRFGPEGDVETYCNRQDFLVTSGATPGDKYLMFQAMAVAEQHLLHSEVALEFRVEVPLTAANIPGLNFQATAHFYRIYGGRWDSHLSPAAPYPVVLNLRKYPTHGRTGKAFFAGALREMDIRRDEDGRVWLKPGHDTANLAHDFYHAKMFESPFVPVLSTHDWGSFQPREVRLIERFGGFTAQRITSVPDAQQRKTYLAFPYRQQCHDFAPILHDAGAMYRHLCYDVGEEVEIDLLVNFLVMWAPVKNSLMSISEYYTEGVKLSLAPQWRPMAGFNPHTLEAQNIIEQMKIVEDKFIEELKELMSSYPDGVPQTDLQSLERRTWQLAGMYALFFERERFTGTPIPLDINAPAQ